MKNFSSGAPAYMVSVFLTLTSAILGLFVSSGFSMWMMMELGVCAFCGVLATTESSKSEGVGKYFVVSSMAGVVLLCGVLVSWAGGELLVSFLLMSLWMKLGLPPFHFWVVGVLRGCTWSSAFLLLTIQKVLPLSFLGSSLEMGKILLFFSLGSAVAAGIGGLGYHEPYYLFGFSSMVVSSWFVMVSTVDLEVMLSCIIIYTFTFFILLLCLPSNESEGWFGEYNPWAMLMLVVLMGLPNGPIFLMKIWVYQALLSIGCTIGAWGVALTSVMLLPLYLRVVTMMAFGLWGHGLNESTVSGQLMIPFMLAVMLVFFSGAGWTMFLACLTSVMKHPPLPKGKNQSGVSLW